jgi:hypothetical protein
MAPPARFGVGVEQVVELAGERVGGRPAEVVGDDDPVFASSELYGPDAIGWSAVGADVGMFDFDGDAGSAGCPVAG